MYIFASRASNLALLLRAGFSPNQISDPKVCVQHIEILLPACSQFNLVVCCTFQLAIGRGWWRNFCWGNWLHHLSPISHSIFLLFNMEKSTIGRECRKEKKFKEVEIKLHSVSGYVGGWVWVLTDRTYLGTSLATCQGFFRLSLGGKGQKCPQDANLEIGC